MNRFRNSLAAAAGLGLLVATIATLSIRSARAGAPLPSTPVRYVEAGARDPKQDTASVLLHDGEAFGHEPMVFGPVPTGKRLVIEFVSAFAHLQPNQRPDVTLTIIQGNRAVLHHIAFPQSNLLDDVDMMGSQVVTLYADPGTTPIIDFRRSGGTSGVAFVAVSISGHFVTL